MQTPNFLNKFTVKRINSIELLMMLFLTVLFLPYVVLSFFNAPAVDDYSNALISMDFGFWGGQMEAYKQWGGRYFSSFILCINVLMANTFLLYKVLPVLLMIGNIHALYKLMKVVMLKSNALQVLILALSAVFLYLNVMPSISQGIYWAPGAVTYNVGNIMYTYMLGYLIQASSLNATFTQKGMAIGTTILTCGLNESTMLAANLSIMLFLLYYLITTKRLHAFLMWLLMIAIICTIFSVLSPGNYIRDAGFTDPHKKNLLFTISSSYTALFNFLNTWLFNWRMLILSFFTLIFIVPEIKENTLNKNRILRLILILTLGLSIIAAALAPGFWGTGYIAPDRSINVVFWLFMLWWFIMLYSIAEVITPLISKIKMAQTASLLVIVSVCFSFYFQEFNYSRAVSDIITGRAYVYKMEWNSRLELISKSKGLAICEIPEFSMIPGTIFFDDIKPDPEEWFNRQFARYYQLSKVKLVKRASQAKKKVNINFENDQIVFKNPANLSTAFSKSAPNSNLLNGIDSYSAAYEVKVKEIDPTGLSFKTIVLDAHVFTPSTEVDYVLVISFSDKNGKTILWQGKDVKNVNYPINIWNKETFSCTIKESAALMPDNNIAVYIWNRGKNAIYLDDIEITFE
ncbi:MAG TPA: DUF6056 family protein [Bacteroidia bacterium]|nr:DUF6056 family protein [Bacteroidia bacterium]